MAKKEYVRGNKVEVFLKKSDFDMFKNNPIHNYVLPDDCPLARAVKRTFKTNNVTVCAFDWGVTIDGENWSNRGEWHNEIANIVGGDLHAGDKTRYYVTLTKL